MSVVVTVTQYEALEALARHGTMKVAAYSLGITTPALKRRMGKVRRRTGLTTYQLLHRLGQGRIDVQDGFWLDAA